MMKLVIIIAIIVAVSGTIVFGVLFPQSEQMPQVSSTDRQELLENEVVKKFTSTYPDSQQMFQELSDKNVLLDNYEGTPASLRVTEDKSSSDVEYYYTCGLAEMTAFSTDDIIFDIESGC